MQPPLTEKWKIIQRWLKQDDDGKPGDDTADAVAAALGIKWPVLPEPGVRLTEKPSPEPSWMLEARKWIGLKERPGPNDHPQILSWWQLIKSSVRDDETPWCAAFVGGCLEQVRIKSTRAENARSYSSRPDVCRQLSTPAQGCIVVFWRGSPAGWQGHVAFLAGIRADGTLVCVGGNQGDSVSVADFAPYRLIGFYWPTGTDADPADYPVRRIGGPKGTLSQNEA